MTDGVKRIDAAALKAALHDGGEIALLDAREEVAFGKRHLLLAACVPLSQLEFRLDDLVPRRAARVVWTDGGEGLAELAARRTAGFGWSDVAVLDGGIEAWARAGYRLYSGVHVPSKAFAEVVEHEAATPWVGAEELQRMMSNGDDIVVLDSRSYAEYRNNSIPTAVSVPGAELVLRFTDLVLSPETTAIVNCGGRTRSIVGAQSLINAGFKHRIVSLKDGTMAWHLAGFDVIKGASRRPPRVSARGLAAATAAAERVAARFEIPRVGPAEVEGWRGEADRTLYLFDVRTPEEYEAGHLPGVLPAPGGQLVQETDSHAATWGARIVLVDDNGVRATMTASWLRQMGWAEVAVMRFDPAAPGLARGPHAPRVLGLEHANPATIAPAEVQAKLAAGRAAVVDLATSRQYRQGHIPGAWFAVRARLERVLARLTAMETVVLTSPDGVMARLAAAEQAAPVLALAGGTLAWRAAGLPLEAGPTHMADEADDVWLSARDRDGDLAAHMREYLAWEIDLVNQMASDDDHRFRVGTG
jgi:rhodanese-related sulfurtransferase